MCHFYFYNNFGKYGPVLITVLLLRLVEQPPHLKSVAALPYKI